MDKKRVFELYDVNISPNENVRKVIIDACPNITSLYEPFCFTGAMLRMFSGLNKLVACDIDGEALDFLAQRLPKAHIHNGPAQDFCDPAFKCDVTYIGNQGHLFFRTFDELSRGLESLCSMTEKTIVIQHWRTSDILNHTEHKMGHVTWRHTFNEYTDEVYGELVDPEGNRMQDYLWTFWQPAIIKHLVEKNGFHNFRYVSDIPGNDLNDVNAWIFMVADRKEV